MIDVVRGHMIHSSGTVLGNPTDAITMEEREEMFNTEIYKLGPYCRKLKRF